MGSGDAISWAGLEPAPNDIVPTAEAGLVPAQNMGTHKGYPYKNITVGAGSKPAQNKVEHSQGLV